MPQNNERTEELRQKWAWLVDGIKREEADAILAELEALASNYGTETAWPVEFPANVSTDPGERWDWLCSQRRQNKIIPFRRQK